MLGGRIAQASQMEVSFHSLVPEGSLIVYTKTFPSLSEAGAQFDWENNSNLHTPYTITRSDGTVLEKVNNHVGLWDEQPTPVYLPRGKYWIHAFSSKGDQVVVPVEIREGAQTVLHL